MKKLIGLFLAFILLAVGVLPSIGRSAYASSIQEHKTAAIVSETEEKQADSIILKFFSKIAAFISKIIENIKKLFGGIKNIDINPDAAPSDYETNVTTGGVIESTYLKHGEYDVSYYEQATDEKWAKYEIYYPSSLENSNRVFPVIIMANGSGVRGSRYAVVFKHYASWGFIVIGNEHDTAYSGDSSDASLAFLIAENDNPNSVLYQKVDLENVGIVGHSQGGVGVFAAITKQPHSNMYKTAVSLSPVPEKSAKLIHWDYDPTKVSIPVMVLAGTENDTISPTQLAELYSHITSGKVAAVRSGTNHPQMLYSADGYVTAWFMWHLQGDDNAARAFTGTEPEIKSNQLYLNQQIDIHE